MKKIRINIFTKLIIKKITPNRKIFSVANMSVFREICIFSQKTVNFFPEKKF